MDLVAQTVTGYQTLSLPVRTVLLIGFIVSLLFIGELVTYLLHRFFFHTDVVPDVHQIHRYHHVEADDAIHDYLIIAFLLLGGLLTAFILTIFRILPVSLTLLVFTVWTGYFLFSWYVHRAYHTGSFLHQFPWFEASYAEHLVHHDFPSKNYGILTRYMDRLFSTYQPADLKEKHKN